MNQIITFKSKLILFFIFIVYCCSDNKSENNAEDFHEFNYFIDYALEHNFIVDVDSFNLLFRSLHTFKLNDSNLAFTSYFKNRFFFLIQPDSIHIFEYSFFQEREGLIFDVFDLMKQKPKQLFDQVLNLVKKEFKTVYEYRFSDQILEFVGFSEIYNSVFVINFYIDDFAIRIQYELFTYVKSIKNTRLQLNNYHFLRHFPYDVEKRRVLDISTLNLLKKH